ncbi:RNA-binding domain-containing protein [Halarcobacter ebronensis]|uniref:ATP-dependent DNA helicase n=1 Tax=Halarcobacter ebronensis TaxID=1462615 RepID=A0A4Q1ALN9_9BACT|nr:RNA-binding domain-containing protein [Halarcobacter ebronensis]QKF83364.1 putative transcriptional regulator [Halarcobacter ebronensis]RXK05924.1 ATP-dependent DNA helicase [Halarcobacter ebronensis]
MRLIEQISLGESKTLEFKQELPENKKIAKTVISFSNTAGGKLIIGVDDDRNIVGIEEENIFELQDKIASIIYDNCTPNIIPEIYTVNCEGKLLLVVEVFRGNLLPYYLKSEGKNQGTYIRVGASNRKAEYENILELERQKRNIGFDEEVNYDIEFESLDLTPLYESFKSVGKTLDEKKLENLKLIKKESNKTYATNALLIILGTFSHTSVKCARFKGITMDMFIDKKEYQSDIFSNLENTQNFILNHINLKGEIKALQRTDTYEIPLVALREALINAFIHRDYTNSGRDIKVGVYDDIVNIVSPGSFPNTITKEDIENGRSETRNKVLANIFKELGLIEQWGSGIKRIKTLCLENHLKEPMIEEKSDFVDVEFYRPQDRKTDDYERILPEMNDYKRLRTITNDYERLTIEEKAILIYILDNQKITRKEAVKLTGLQSTKVYEILKTLVEDKKILKRCGNGRSTYYKVAK